MAGGYRDRRCVSRSGLAVRGAGTSAQAASLWTTCPIITVSLLTIINAIGSGPTMWLCAAFNVAAWIFVYKRLPELTGRSLEEIEKSPAQWHLLRKDFEADNDAASAEWERLKLGTEAA